MGRLQTETITIRVTPEEKHSMQGKMYEAVAPSMREFILRMCMDGKVIVNSDLRELNQELRYCRRIFRRIEENKYTFMFKGKVECLVRNY